MRKILLSEKVIQERIQHLASEINEHLVSKKIKNLTLIWIADGAAFFAEDLAKYLNINLEVFSIKISSYGNEKKSYREPLLIGSLPDVKGKDLLLLDDILDTGNTLFFAKNLLKENKAKEIFTCVLLDKKIKNEKKMNSDFVGFEIENVFVYGYGLDLEDKLRELRDVYFE